MTGHDQPGAAPAPTATSRATRADDQWADREHTRLEHDTIPTIPPTPHRATDYIHTTHPDTGRPVIFTPGDTLPTWALADAGIDQATPDGDDPDAGSEEQGTRPRGRGRAVAKPDSEPAP